MNCECGVYVKVKEELILREATHHLCSQQGIGVCQVSHPDLPTVQDAYNPDTHVNGKIL